MPLPPQSMPRATLAVFGLSEVFVAREESVGRSESAGMSDKSARSVSRADAIPMVADTLLAGTSREIDRDLARLDVAARMNRNAATPCRRLVIVNRRASLLLTPVVVAGQGLDQKFKGLAADCLACLHLLRKGAETCVRLKGAFRAEVTDNLFTVAPLYVVIYAKVRDQYGSTRWYRKGKNNIPMESMYSLILAKLELQLGHSIEPSQLRPSSVVLGLAWRPWLALAWRSNTVRRVHTC
jgi:hypothetical protein